MTETQGKRDRLREERREQILGAALAVFTQKGYHAANVSDVAAQAGVSQGTIYWYFESKEDLFNAAILSVFDDFGQEWLSALEQCTTASEKLWALSEAMEDFGQTAESLFMLFLNYWASSSNRQDAAQLWADLLGSYKDLTAAIIEEGVQNGEFAPVDASALVWAILAAYDGLAAYLALMPDLDLARVNKVFVETLVKGLKADLVEES